MSRQRCYYCGKRYYRRDRVERWVFPLRRKPVKVIVNAGTTCCAGLGRFINNALRKDTPLRRVS